MKKPVIGFIYNCPVGCEEKIFFKVAKRLNIDLVPFDLTKEIKEDELEEKANRCDIIYDDSGDPIANEIVKTLEVLGKKVIESGKIAYTTEDKWLFFMECKKHKIPTPDTILLTTDLDNAKQELKEFGHWPVILKRIYGTWGEFVDKADNVNEAMRIIKNFWKKGNERLPIIAQEYVNSDQYRVTTIGNEIVQTTIKERSGWKATGVHVDRFRKFKVDNELKKMVDKIIKISHIDICGIDFAKKEGKWVVIEANAEPSLCFFETERDKLTEKVLLLLKKLI